MPNPIERFVSNLFRVNPPSSTARTTAREPAPAGSIQAPVQPAEPQVSLPGDTRISAGGGRTLDELANQAGEMGDLNLPGVATDDDVLLAPELNRKSDPDESSDPDGTTNLWTPVTPKDAASLRKAADKIFFKAVAPSTGTNYRHIERDGLDVNAKTPRTDQVAAKQVNAGLKFENANVARLSKDEQAAYKAIAEGLKGNPRGRLALQVLLAEGTLTDPRKGTLDGQSLLSQLAAVTSGPLAAGIDRKALLSELAQELATPSAIDQQNRGTCTAGVIQIKLASERPGEYARLVAGLASPEGQVTMANGDCLVREPGTETPDQTARSVPSRLFQPALVEYANGRFDYDNTTDTNAGADGGLSIGEFARALSAASGEQIDARTLGLMQAIQVELAAGRTVPVGMKWKIQSPEGRIDLNHEVLVTGIRNGRVYYDNPWGQQESMTLGNFAKRVNSAAILHSSAPAPDPGLNEDAYLQENRDIVVSNLEGLIGSYQAAMQSLGDRTDTEARRFQTYLDQGIAVVTDLRDQMRAMPLPSQPSTETSDAYMEFLNTMNGMAIAMAQGGQGAPTADDLRAAFDQIRHLPPAV